MTLRSALLACILLTAALPAAAYDAPQVRVPTIDPNVDQICEIMPGALGTPLCTRQINKTTGLVTWSAPFATTTMDLAVSPGGNPTYDPAHPYAGGSAIRNTHTTQASQLVATDGTSRNFGQIVTLTCAVGGGSLSPLVIDQTDNDDACVASYRATVMNPGSGDGWADNVLVQVNPGVGSVHGRGRELDLNILNKDYDPGREEPGTVQPPAWAATTNYKVGDMVTVAGAREYVTYTGGVTGSTAPTVTISSTTKQALTQVDGNVTWTYTGAYPSSASFIGDGITGYGGGCLKDSGGVNCALDGYGHPKRTAFAVTAGYFLAALNGPIAHRGFVAAGNSVDGCVCCDYNSGADTSLYIKGVHNFGIDLGYMSGVPLRIANASPIQAFTYGTSTAINLMALDTGNNLTLGTNAVSIQPQAPVIPYADVAVDLGSGGTGGKRFGTVWAGNAQINNIKAIGTLTGPFGTPASSSATCAQGQMMDDASFHYVCTATNHWRRVAISDF